MTYDQSAHITDLQARNTALVDRVRILERVAKDRGPAISAILRAYHGAVAKHQQFPAAIDSQGVILAEEVLELTMEMLGAVLAVVRSINDHRDEVPNLGRIREETTHVGAVVMRMLGRIDGAKG
ncbi:hypothetical protein [Solidesulfovibrio sp.]